MILRYEFQAAVTLTNLPHHESGEHVEEPIHPDLYSRWHPLQAHRGGASLNGIGNEVTNFLNCLNLFLLQLESFAFDGNLL